VDRYRANRAWRHMDFGVIGRRTNMAHKKEMEIKKNLKYIEELLTGKRSNKSGRPLSPQQITIAKALKHQLTEKLREVQEC
jgi:hypothetical protein